MELKMARKTFNARRPHLLGAVTQQGNEISATEAKRRSIMAAARRVASLERKAKTLTRQLRETKADLRFARKEFAALTQEREMFVDVKLELPAKKNSDDVE